MNQTQLTRIGFIVLLVTIIGGGLLYIKLWAPERTDFVSSRVVGGMRPEVACSNGHCTIRAAVLVGEKILVSSPLPFPAASEETLPILADLSFEFGNLKGREITAWSIGIEEKSIVVAMEPITIDTGQGIIVHQITGVEHPKRAHIVLEIMKDGLKTHFEIIEGVGPESILLWPEPEGIALSRSFGDTEIKQIERYHWKGSGLARSLVLQ